MNEQQLKEAFMQYLQQKSGAQTQQEFEAYIQQLGEEGLQQEYAQFMKMMQQQQVAARKFGGMLNYIGKLRGVCPEGYEMQFFKQGGQICKKCVQKAKMEDGGKTPQNPVDAFKCGRKMKKKACGGSVEKDKCGSKMKKKACGGSVKKEYTGGTFPTTTPANERYVGGTYYPQTYGPASIGQGMGFGKWSAPAGEAVVATDGSFLKYPSMIRRNIVDGDTIISETPSYNRFIPVSTGRSATSAGNRQEFETLNRRFEQAKKVTK